MGMGGRVSAVTPDNPDWLEFDAGEAELPRMSGILLFTAGKEAGSLAGERIGTLRMGTGAWVVRPC